MPERDHEFQAPTSLAPDRGASSLMEPPSQRLTNEDFRKLMMTPRAGAISSSSLLSGSLGSGHVPTTPSSDAKKDQDDSSVKAGNRKKKKSYYAKLKREEDDKMAELASKYRDRAKERREGVDLAAPGAERAEDGPNASTGGYRAVAPDIKSSHDAAERRKRMIQESKFLGGDMEHTHLVKGLDFALLQKVRSEIASRELSSDEGDADEDDEKDEEEEEYDRSKKAGKADEAVAAEDQDKVACRTALAKNVLRTVFRTDIPERNELFFPGRMAYIIELDEEGEANDIPTTTIRSKADVAGNLAHQQASSMSTNDIVINKLTQILSYLRAGSRHKKKKKAPAFQESEAKAAQPMDAVRKPVDDVPIYDGVGDYVPSLKRQDHDRSRGEGRERARHRDRDRHHRDRNRDRDRHHNERSHKEDRKSRSYFDSESKDEPESATHKGGFSDQDKELIQNLMRREEEKSKKNEAKVGQMLAAKEPDGYAECYPGFAEMNDAIDDSDDEVDYSKMDLGNKKGPVGRWDFDTTEEYADYMSRKEALPKAAFQYGVKMAEGRKTRGKVGKANEKAKLDKEWNQISAILDKRKAPVIASAAASKRSKFD